jgi:hypothetical protein
MISEEDGQLKAGGGAARPGEGYHREQVFFLERVGSDAEGHHLVALRSAASGTCLDRVGWAFFGSDQLGVGESRADTDIAKTMLFAVEMSGDGGDQATAPETPEESRAAGKFALRHVDTGRYVTLNRPKRVGQAASLTLSSRRSLEGAGKPGLTLLQLEVLAPTPTYDLTVRAAAGAADVADALPMLSCRAELSRAELPRLTPSSAAAPPPSARSLSSAAPPSLPPSLRPRAVPRAAAGRPGGARPAAAGDADQPRLRRSPERGRALRPRAHRRHHRRR